MPIELKIVRGDEERSVSVGGTTDAVRRGLIRWSPCARSPAAGRRRPMTRLTEAIEEEALDAYSSAVSTAAARLIPSVASLRVERRNGGWGGGSGSAVAFTPDGFLVTNAHVVAGAERGTATFVDGDELGFEVVGRDPLSDLAVVRAAGSGSGRRAVRRRRPSPGRPAGRRDRQSARLRRVRDRRRGQRPRPLAGGPATARRAGSSRTSSRPTRRSTPATPGGALADIRGRVVGHQHGGRRRRARAGRADRRRHPADHRRPDARRSGPARLPRGSSAGRAGCRPRWPTRLGRTVRAGGRPAPRRRVPRQRPASGPAT